MLKKTKDEKTYEGRVLVICNSNGDIGIFHLIQSSQKEIKMSLKFLISLCFIRTYFKLD
jgi:hypothetical protein